MKLAFSPRFLSSLVLSLLLISPALAQRKDAANKTVPGANLLSLNQQDALDLLKTLAQELKSEADKPAAASLQARIADVLWQYDDSFAKEAFRWALDAAKKPPSEDLAKAARATYIARQANSLREVLSRLGTHDQKQAETWLKSLQEEKLSETKTSEASDVRRELLMQIALQLVTTEPEQAQRLGLLALAGNQIPEDFGRLLFALGNIGRSQSDPLFRAALANLKRNDCAYSSSLLALVNYVFSSSGALYPDASVSDAELLANYFVDAAWRQSRGATTQGLPESSASFYGLIEVRGWPIVSRYAAERMPELQGQMRELASRLSQSQLENTARLKMTQQQQIAVSTRSSHDIEEQIERAIKEKDVQVRDSLLNSIAHSLMRSDSERALKLAGMIDDTEIRGQAEDDINLVKIQQLLGARSYEDARKTALKLKNSGLQAQVLVTLASKSLSEKDTTRASDLLSEAVELTSKNDPVSDKLLSLLLIAQQFVKFDSIRGFEVLGSAIKTVNQLKSDETPRSSALAKPRLMRIKTYTMINGSELSTSDHATFDSIDFSQVAPFVANDYMQTRLLGSKIEQPLRRAKFLTAVASVMLLSNPKETQTAQKN
ncbi:MAG TPA: hypothetical protein VKB05_04115 [Pyrinomonadaceae bacterium]|nr:hypothetical protein [Pyrinomonadaceae bacterium]